MQLLQLIYSELFTVYVFTSCIGFVASPGVVPIILNAILPRNESFKKSLCIYAEYFVDQDEYFYYLFSHTIFCGLMTVGIHAAIDTTFASCVQHALALLNIVK